MEILITGGNGFLGRNLILALHERGDHVRVLVSPTSDTAWLEQRGVTLFRGDIRDSEVLEDPMRGADAVVHLAAIIKVWGPMQDSHAINVIGTENVCRAALTTGIRRLIYTSSAMIYNMAHGQPATEENILAPLDEPYSKTKAESDTFVQRMVAEEYLPAVILRLGPLIGPGDSLNFGRTADRLRTGKGFIIGSGNNTIPFVYTSDVVQAILLALDNNNAVGQVYNIGSDQPLTQKEYLSAIAQEIGIAPPRIHVPYQPMYAAGYAAERVAALSANRIKPIVTRHGVKIFGANNRLCIDKAHLELGYTPQVSIREGVRLTSIWYQQNTSTSERDSVTQS